MRSAARCVPVARRRPVRKVETCHAHGAPHGAAKADN